jgi:hypothetical protein
MSVELKIRWDGEVHGLGEHRIDLAEFGDSLVRLNRAIQVLAAAILAGREGDPTYNPGRLSAIARDVHVQLVSIEEGSAMPVFNVGWVTERTLTTGADLPSRAAQSFMDELDDLAEGAPTSRAVRAYFENLPRRLSRNTHSLSIDGREVQVLELGEVAPPTNAAMLPNLLKVRGQIEQINFSSRRVAIRDERRGRVRASVTSGQAQEAARLAAEGLGVEARMSQDRAGNKRFIWIRAEGVTPTPTAEETLRSGRENWSELLDRLAE